MGGGLGVTIDLESGQTRMIEAETIDAISTIRLLESLQALYPLMVCIHVSFFRT